MATGPRRKGRAALRGWRVPAAVIAVVALVALAVFLIALSAVSSDANHEAGALVSTTTGSLSP